MRLEVVLGWIEGELRSLWLLLLLNLKLQFRIFTRFNPAKRSKLSIQVRREFRFSLVKPSKSPRHLHPLFASSTPSSSFSCLVLLPHVPDHPPRLCHISITAHVHAIHPTPQKKQLDWQKMMTLSIQSSSPSSIDFRLIRKSCSDTQRRSEKSIEFRVMCGRGRRKTRRCWEYWEHKIKKYSACHKSDLALQRHIKITKIVKK